MKEDKTLSLEHATRYMACGPGRICIFVRRPMAGPAMRGLGEHDPGVFGDGAGGPSGRDDLQRRVSMRFVQNCREEEGIRERKVSDVISA